MNRSLLVGLAAVVLILGTAWLIAFERDAVPLPADQPLPVATPSTPSDPVPVPVAASIPSATAPSSERRPEAVLRRLRVLAADDKPCAEARVVFFDDERVESVGETDAMGWIGVPAHVAARSVALAPHNAPPYTVRLDWDARAETIVRLPAGQRVAGAVLVDGAPPGGSRPLKLDLWSNGAGCKPGGDSEVLPHAVWTALEIDLERSLHLRATTDALGAFAFHGLSPDWSGALDGPTGFVLEPGHSLPAGVVAQTTRLRLSEPREGLMLHLVSKLTVRGRVVSSDGSAGVAGASVRFTTLSEHGREGPRTNADDSGHFTIAVNPLATAKPEVVVRRADGSAEREIELGDFPSGATEWDVGDLPLAPTRTLDLLVLDADGAPIEGARVREWDGEPRDAEPGFYALLATTDASGRCSVSAIRGFAVSAPRHERRDLLVPDVVPDVLEVVLQRACTLEIHVAAEGEGDATGLEISIETLEPLFAENDGWIPPYDRSLDLSADSYGVDRSGEGGRFQFAPPVGKASLLSGVRPRVPLVLQLVDTNGFVALEQREAGLYPGEQRVVELTVRDSPTRFTGRVIDANGAPLEGAFVHLTYLSAFWTNAEPTDADGGFSISGYFREAATLEVRHQGLGLNYRHRDWLPPADGGFARIELPRMRTVRAQVVCAGRPVESGTFAYEQDGERVIKRAHFKSGRHEIRGVPDAVSTLLLAFGGTEYAQPIASGDVDVRFEVPATGTVVVDLTGERGPTEYDSWSLHLGTKGVGPAALTCHVRSPESELPKTYTFDEVVPGTHELRLDGFSWAAGDLVSAGPVEVFVRAGETTTVSFDVEALWNADGE